MLRMENIKRVTLLLLLNLLITHLFAQTNTIKNVQLIPDTLHSGIIRKIIFSPDAAEKSKERELSYSENLYVSPKSEIICIKKWGSFRDQLAEYEIYDSYGNLTKVLNLINLTSAIITDDGKIAVYGAPPTEDISIERYLNIYDTSGVLKYSKNRVYGNCRGMFSDNGKYFIFIADSCAKCLDHANAVVEILILNDLYQQIGYNKLVVSLGSGTIYPPIINISTEEILLKKYCWISNKQIVTEMIIDFSGAIKRGSLECQH